MARPDPAVALRVPSRARRERPTSTPDADGGPRLRLVATRGRLGVELDAPFELGPVTVDELSLTLPEIRFPVELSGGVRAFRHKRGTLEHLRITLSAAVMQRWAAPLLRDALGGELVHHIVAPLEEGFLVGIANGQGALAFDVVLAPLAGDLRLVPTRARQVGLAEPPQVLAARALHALARPLGKLAGSTVLIEGAPAELSQRLLPLAGMRAAAARAVAWSAMTLDLHAVALEAERDASSLPLGARAVSSVELAALVAEAEESLLGGDLDGARAHYLTALARAPRHLEISRRLAELDAAHGGRAEAALSVLSDAQPPVEAGALGGRLLAQVGDQDGARAALERAASQEPYGPLAARLWLQLAELRSGDAQMLALDEAIARAPSLTAPRWQRFERRVRAGDLRGARADLEHLEAAASGAHARFLALRRAAEQLLEQRALSEASETFERALRYAPSSTDAVAGLARCLGLLGHKRRALELMSRAVALAERSQQPAHRATIDLAVALVEVADDRPAAIAHVSTIESFTPAVFEARLLEARWRGELGDLAGASAALARLADAVEAVAAILVDERRESDGPCGPLWGVVAGDAEAPPYASREEARAAIASFLEEGARIHELDRRDYATARQLLTMALRLAPRRASVRSAFRRVAEAVDALLERPREDVAPAQPAPPEAPAPEPHGREPDGHELPEGGDVSRQPLTQRSSHPGRKLASPPEPEQEAEEAAEAPAMPTIDLGDEAIDEANIELEARVEQLTELLRGDPGNEGAADELAMLLEQLGRDHDLLALLSARIDEGSGEVRTSLVERRRAVLERLIEVARAAGREDEAALYALMLQRDE